MAELKGSNDFLGVTQPICPCCGKRYGHRPLDLTKFGLNVVLLCDWCEESLIEGGTVKDIADTIRSKLS